MPVGGPLYRQHAQRVHTGRPSTMQSCRRASWPSSPPLPPLSPFSLGAPRRRRVRPRTLPDAATLLKESSETTKCLNRACTSSWRCKARSRTCRSRSLEGDLTNMPAVAAQGKANIVFLGSGSRRSTSSSSTATCSVRSPGQLPGLGPGRRHLRRVGPAEPRHRAGQRTGQLLRPEGRRARDHQRRRHRQHHRQGKRRRRQQGRAIYQGNRTGPRHRMDPRRTATTNWSSRSWNRRPATPSR